MQPTPGPVGTFPRIPVSAGIGAVAEDGAVPLTVAELLERCRAAVAAAEAGDELVERHLRIGGRPVLLRAVGEVAAALRSPLAHLEVEPPMTAPELTIHAWAAPGADPLLDLDRTGLPATDQLRFAELGADACLMAWPAEGLVQGFERGTAPGGGDEAFWWVPGLGHLPIFELAMPFRPIFHWWSEAIGLQMVHAAAVGTPEHGAVLRGGASGSGKSTTSLWALTSETLVFLGDDYVLVDPGGPEVFSLYTTAKVHEPDQGRVPHIRAEVVGRQEDDKLVAFLHEPFADRIVERLPVSALVLPHVGGDGPRFTPVDAGEAFRRLAPSTVLQFQGSEPGRAMAALRRLVQSVPAFDLALGDDPAASPAAIEDLLAVRPT
jgi:hypothetical protein